MAADVNLIKGEALVAKSGNINYDEEIGKGLETIAESIGDANKTIQGWYDKEAGFNDTMAKIDTDDFLGKEKDALIEFVTSQKAKYAEAAKKASRIQNKSSEEYKSNVKIMNDVNLSFQTLSKEKQNLLDDRQFNKDNPNIYSRSNSLDEAKSNYFDDISGESGFGVDFSGHVMLGGKKYKDLGKPAQKSPVNGILRENLKKAYLSSEESGRIFSANELENAGKDVEALFAQAANKKLLARQLLLDPILGVETLAGNVDIRGLEEPELIQLVKNSYMDLLKDQSTRGKQEHRNETKVSEFENYRDSDTMLEGFRDFVQGNGGSDTATLDKRTYKLIESKDDNDKPTYKIAETINTGVDSETADVISSTSTFDLFTSKGKLNYSGAASYSDSKQKQRRK